MEIHPEGVGKFQSEGVQISFLTTSGNNRVKRKNLFARKCASLSLSKSEKAWRGISSLSVNTGREGAKRSEPGSSVVEFPD